MDLPAANGLVASGSTARLVRSSSVRLSGALGAACAADCLRLPDKAPPARSQILPHSEDAEVWCLQVEY